MQKLLRPLWALIYINCCEVSASERDNLRGIFGEKMGKNYRLLYEF
nr:MAG TPA: cell division control protein 13 [Caudoviricetes sp.]